MKKIYFSLIVLLVVVASSCNNTKYLSPVTVQFDVQSYEWTASGTSGSSNYLYYHQHSMPGITDGVVSTGTVLGYVKTGSYWAALPFTETYSSYTSNYNYSYETGDVLIIRKDSDLLTTAPGGPISIKIIILTEKHMPLIDNIDINNYHEVSQALNLDKE